jgi:hypothetical protein
VQQAAPAKTRSCDADDPISHGRCPMPCCCCCSAAAACLLPPRVHPLLAHPSMDGGESSGLAVAQAKVNQQLQVFLDRATPHSKGRWGGAAALCLLYIVRVYYVQGFYIITYALGIYLLHLFIGFLSPKTDIDRCGEPRPASSRPHFFVCGLGGVRGGSPCSGPVETVRSRLLLRSLTSAHAGLSHASCTVRCPGGSGGARRRGEGEGGG